MGGKHSAGKGDTYRSVDWEQYSKNYDLIFKKGKKNERSKTNRSSNRRTTNRKG
jgi:hypothetical protein